MIEIKLTQNQITVIDHIDSDLVELNWCAHWQPSSHGFYAVNGKQRLHRVILARILGRELLRSEQVDHKNHNTLDNRRSNLRLATQLQNRYNSKKREDNESGYKGVRWKKDHNKWQSRITIDNKQMHLGYFDNPIDAALAYDQAAKEYFGEYAYVNFPDN